MSEYRDRAKEYHDAIHSILLNEWDPIGVSDIPEAHNEYDSYIRDIYGLLIRHESEQNLFGFLWQIETGHMGLSGNRRHTEQIAGRLIQMREQMESGDRPDTLRSYRTTRRVEFRDTDAAGIAHFSAFFFYMESVEHEFLRSLGLSVLATDDAGPVSWPRVSVSCEYQSAARFEELLEVELRIARAGGESVTYEFAFARDGHPVATGKTVAVCCRFPTGGPPVSIPIPPPIAAKLRPFSADNGNSESRI